MFVDSISYTTVDSNQINKDASPEDLTEHQARILVGMANGKANLVTAQGSILSESTIKLESTGLFRSQRLLPDEIKIKI